MEEDMKRLGKENYTDTHTHTHLKRHTYSQH